MNAPDKICGIYFLYHKNELVYVGQSTNCISRILAHERDSDKEFDVYEIAECKESDLNILELFYIEKYSPKYNVNHVGVEADNLNKNVLKILISALIRLPEIPNTEMTRQYLKEIKSTFRKMGVEMKDNRG